MRIISGIYKSRIIDYPKDASKVRPTKDRIREAIFSIIRDKIEKAVVLDLFSGSGAYGLESLSNSASFCYFNDNYIDSYNTIIKNINSLKINNDKYKVFKLDYLDCLNKLNNENIKFDIVFIDPPYKYQIYENIVNYLYDNQMLNDDFVLILECDKKYDLKLDDNIFLMKQYQYKDTIIYVIRRKM